MKSRIEILSRNELENALKGKMINKDNHSISFGDFNGFAVISFCDTDRIPVDLSATKADYITVMADDLDYDEICKRYGDYYKFLSEADDIAQFIIRAVSSGKNIVCQCEYGMSRSAGCAAAIYEFFMGTGVSVFTDRKYYPSTVIFEKIYEALCCAKLSITDIDVGALRTERAHVDRQEMISKLFGMICSLKNYSCDEILCVTAITKDKEYHFYEGGIFYELIEPFIDKYSVDDILYIGLTFRNKDNEFGAEFVDSECGIMPCKSECNMYCYEVKQSYGVLETDA